MHKHTLLLALFLSIGQAAFSQCLSGNYTLGAEGDFVHFQALQERLDNFGVCGPTRIILLPERHIGGLNLTSTMGINTTNTLEITAQDGNKGAVIWQKGPTDNQIPLLRMNGVSGVWLHDLRISTNNGAVSISAQNGSQLRLERLDMWSFESTLYAKNMANCSIQDCKIEARIESLNFEECQNIALKGLELYCPIDYDSYPSLHFFNCNDSYMKHSYVYGNVWIYEGKNIGFHHNELYASIVSNSSSDGGFWVRNTDSVRITNNVFYDEYLLAYDLVSLNQTPNGLFAHNSLYISTAKAALFVLQDQFPNIGKLQILNNIITGVHPNCSPLVVQGDYSDFISDYNCIWSAGSNLIAIGIGSLNQTLSEWQTNFQQDLHSTVTKPTFLSRKNLRIKGNLPALSGKGLYLPGVSELDLDGDPRPAGLADIGADQFSGILTSVKLSHCNVPVAGCHGLPTVAVKLKNEGLSTLRQALIFWKINGDTALRPLRWKGQLSPGQTSDWIPVFDRYDYNFTSNQLELRVEEGRDLNTTDNTWTVNNFTNRMGGDYTVGGDGADFAQLKDAAEMLYSAGVCGPVNLWLRESAQDPVLMKNIPGSIPARTLRIQPEASGMVGPYLPRLEMQQVKNVQFRRLHFGGVSWNDGPHKRIEFAQCVVDSTFQDGSASDSGMVLNQCLFLKNPVTIAGWPQNYDREWRIENCIFGYDGALGGTIWAGDLTVTFVQGLTLRNCRFYQSANASLTFLNGQVTIGKNRFGSVTGLGLGFSDGTAATPLMVTNNFFHFKGTAPFNTGPACPPLVYLFDSKYLYFLHNTVYYDTENLIFDDPRAIKIHGWENGRFEGNLVKTGGSARMFDFNTSWFTSVFNRNNFDLGPLGIMPGFESLTAWQNLTNLEQNTTTLPVKLEAENDPTGLTLDLHLAADSPNKPLTTNLQAGVTTDFDGQTRSLTSPAIGADEPQNLPLAGAVWPGDCDADMQVSSLDWLQLGVVVGLGLQGPARTDQSISWLPKYAADWQDSVQQVNGKHADCNGDGAATLADTLAIVQNFGEEHFLTAAADDRSGTVLKILLPAGPYIPGQKIAAPIWLGESEELFYGLAMGVAVSGGSLAPGSFWVDYPGSWLGQVGVNMMGFYRKNPVSGEYPVAVVRTDGQQANGFGQLGVLHFTVGSLTDTLKLRITRAQGILSDGTPKTVLPEAVTPVEISLSQNNPEAIPGLALWPNPADGITVLRIPGNTSLLRVRVYDALGREVWTGQTNRDQLRMDLSALPAGVYRVQVGGGWLSLIHY
ncbi:MAG TPA: T9SS type A sorting domain-containing protein [Saprospiraceae bacterium]|nr:T9SS type A sorting domain-containing protein [Saprospiraceae bacterium]